MNNIYEEAYKEAERKIKKLSEDFKKDLDKIFKECTKKKPEDLSNLSTNKQEVTKQDIGKICMFYSLPNSKYYGVLIGLRETIAGTRYVAQSCNGTHPFVHAHRLTKQEIEELC